MSTPDTPKTETPPPIAPPVAAAPEPAAAPAQPPPPAPAPATAPHTGSRWWMWIVLAAGVVLAAIFGVPWIQESLNTVSTDDAFVNGHVTFVAPRVPGQVAKVLVDDNN